MRLIDADALKDALIEYTPYDMGSEFRNTNRLHKMFTVTDALDDAPTVDAVAVARGEWLAECDPTYTANGWYVCTACKDTQYFDDYLYRYNYCPSCGAEMKQEDSQNEH